VEGPGGSKKQLCFAKSGADNGTPYYDVQ
jgi:hypothetical protein